MPQRPTTTGAGAHKAGLAVASLERSRPSCAVNLNKVENIQPMEGQDDDVSLLMKSLSTWKFSPALTQDGPIAVPGRVLFSKGQDYFRYKVSTAFRDSGSVTVPEQQNSPTHPTALSPTTITTVRVPLRIPLDPDAAQNQLVDRVRLAHDNHRQRWTGCGSEDNYRPPSADFRCRHCSETVAL